MKKICLVLVLSLFLVSASYGQALVGSRAAGMGGVGVATCRDLSAAYYNPAAIMKTGGFGGMASVGTATDGLDKLMSIASSATDPGKFISDNFSSNLSVNGSLGGILGVNVNKIGLSVLPMVMLNLTKPANSLAATGGAALMYQAPVTFGHTFGLPGLPDLSVGGNVKYVGQMGGTVVVPAFGNGSQTVTNSTGFGLDVGALMTFNIPAVTELSVGLVARDLAENLNTNTKTYTLTPTATNTFTETLVSDVNSTSTTDPSYALGVAGTIPVVGILAGADLETGNGFTNTHIGLEYPLLANFLALRAGLASGNGLSLTTFGAKIAIPFFAINAAYVIDSNNNKNNQIFLDLAGGV